MFKRIHVTEYTCDSSRSDQGGADWHPPRKTQGYSSHGLTIQWAPPMVDRITLGVSYFVRSHHECKQAWSDSQDFSNMTCHIANKNYTSFLPKAYFQVETWEVSCLSSLNSAFQGISPTETVVPWRAILEAYSRPFGLTKLDKQLHSISLGYMPEQRTLMLIFAMQQVVLLKFHTPTFTGNKIADTNFKCTLFSTSDNKYCNTVRPVNQHQFLQCGWSC